MIIEGSMPEPRFGIEYHARQIRDAIEEAHNDGYQLDDAADGEVENLDLNSLDGGEYVRIIRNGVLLKEMKEA